MKVTLIQTTEAFANLEQDWRRLFDNTPHASTPMRWEWMWTWWETFGPTYATSPGGLHTLIVKDADRVAAILPLYLRYQPLWGAALHMLSTGESPNEQVYPEGLEILCAPEDSEAALDALIDYFDIEPYRSWYSIHFGIHSKLSLLSRLSKALQEILELSVQETAHPAPARVMTDRDPPSTLLRRILRQKSKRGLSWHLSETAPSALQLFDTLLDLHQRRWNALGKLGAFSSARKIDFHRRLIHLLAPHGHALTFQLSWHAKPIASLYGFIHRGVFEFYQSGLDVEQKDVKSAGLLAHLLCMQELETRGVQTYNFLSGESPYKADLANHTVSMHECTIHYPSPRASLKAMKQAARSFFL